MNLPAFATIAIGLVAFTFAGCASSGTPETPPGGLEGGLKTFNFVAGGLETIQTDNLLRTLRFNGPTSYRYIAGEFGVQRYSRDQSLGSLPPATLRVRFYNGSTTYMTGIATVRGELDTTQGLDGSTQIPGVWHYLLDSGYSASLGFLTTGANISVEIVRDTSWDGAKFFTNTDRNGGTEIISGNVPVTNFSVSADG